MLVRRSPRSVARASRSVARHDPLSRPGTPSRRADPGGSDPGCARLAQERRVVATNGDAAEEPCRADQGVRGSSATPLGDLQGAAVDGAGPRGGGPRAGPVWFAGPRAGCAADCEPSPAGGRSSPSGRCGSPAQQLGGAVRRTHRVGTGDGSGVLQERDPVEDAMASGARRRTRRCADGRPGPPARRIQSPRAFP